MKSEKNLISVNRRVGFFNCFFNKGISSLGDYGNMSSMIFEEKKPKVYFTDARVHKEISFYEYNDNTTHYINHNIHHVSEVQNDITLMKNENLQFTNNENVKNSFIKSKNDIFNKKITKNHLILDFDKKYKKTQKHLFYTLFNSKHDELTTQIKYLNIQSQKSFEKLEHKGPNNISMEQIKALENNVVSKIEKRVEVKKEVKNIRTVTREERHIIQQEEKQLSNRVYTMVMKQWQKEKRRKGYLYD